MKTIHLFAAVAVLGGCITAEVTMLVPTNGLLPVEPSQVVIYLNRTEVPATCNRIALVEVDGGSSTSQVYEAARVKAAGIGANAIAPDSYITTGRRNEIVVFNCPSAEETEN